MLEHNITLITLYHHFVSLLFQGTKCHTIQGILYITQGVCMSCAELKLSNDLYKLICAIVHNLTSGMQTVTTKIYLIDLV